MQDMQGFKQRIIYYFEKTFKIKVFREAINFWRQLEELTQMKEIYNLKEHYHQAYWEIGWKAFRGHIKTL